MSDFFKEYFWTSKTRKHTKGEDIHLRVPLTFEEMCHGTKKRFTITRRVVCVPCKGKGGESFQDCGYCKGTGSRRPNKDGLFAYTTECMICKGQGKLPQKTCETCEGSGLHTKKQTINVTFPAGIDPRNVCPLGGMGHEIRNGEPGDILLELHVTPHEHFTRKDFDIHCQLSVGAIRAMVGGEVDVETIHGTAKLKLPPGVQHEQVATIHDEGIHSSQGKGSHVVHICVVTPLLTEEEQEILRNEFPKRAEEPAVIQARKKTSWI